MLLGLSVDPTWLVRFLALVCEPYLVGALFGACLLDPTWCPEACWPGPIKFVGRNY